MIHVINFQKCYVEKIQPPLSTISDILMYTNQSLGKEGVLSSLIYGKPKPSEVVFFNIFSILFRGNTNNKRCIFTSTTEHCKGKKTIFLISFFFHTSKPRFSDCVGYSCPINCAYCYLYEFYWYPLGYPWKLWPFDNDILTDWARTERPGNYIQLGGLSSMLLRF